MRSMARGGGAGEGEEQAVVRVAPLARERPSVSPRNRLQGVAALKWIMARLLPLPNHNHEA